MIATSRWRLLPAFGLAAVLLASVSCLAQGGNDELVQLIVNLLGEKDKDLRSIAFEQVRTEAIGESATRKFAAQLPKLPAEAQVGLLSALAARGDRAARPAVLDLLNDTSDTTVRAAALRALGALGDAHDVPRLASALTEASKDEQAAARASLVGLRGDDVVSVMVAEMKKAPTPLRVALIEVLTSRRALDVVPDLLGEALNSEQAVRRAAMAALGQIAGPEHVAGLVQGVLKAEKGAERDAAERAITMVATRIANAERRAEPLLAAMDGLNDDELLTLLPALGRIGGGQALAIVEKAIASAESRRHDAGIRALCNWPDASIAPRLVSLAETDEHADHRRIALAALIRVAPLPDQRPPVEKLALVKKVMSMCTRDEDRKLVLKRASAIRAVETLRFVIPFLDQPEMAQQACETVVELAHHRQLREPNKAEFHKALDKVLETSKDAVVIDRAKRYKRDQTWVRPKAPDQP